jgi:hypothetical protein
MLMTDDCIRVFVGSEPEQELALQVLTHSIERHTTHKVRVEALWRAVEARGIVIPLPSRRESRPRTPFSFQRFAIPELCGFQGRAIYVDSDMQVFADIAELWTWPFGGHDLLSVIEDASSRRRSQFSVMVLDCASLRWRVEALIGELDRGRYSYEQLVYEMAVAKNVGQVLPTRWNSLERHARGETSLLHYTDMNRQPWLTAVNPLCELWCLELLHAVSSGAIRREVIDDHVRLGWVRPSLAFQVAEGLANPRDIPEAELRRDRRFTPPHCLPSWLKKAAQRQDRVGAAARLGTLGWRTLRRLRAKVSITRGVSVS